MSAGVVDINYIADLNFRQHSVDSELVVVFAQTAGDVINVVQNGIFLTQHRDMVVGAIHGRTHQVCGAGIQAHVLPVDVLLMQHGGNQMTVGSQHEAAQLCEDGHIVHACRGQNLLIALADTLTDDADVAAGLLGAVVHADAAGEVDKGNVTAGANVECADVGGGIKAEGYVEYYKNNQCVASFDLEKETEGKKVYTEVVCHTTDNEIILEFPIVKWIDNYPHCDGEHDRWDCVILGYHQVNFDVNENKVSKPSR